MIIIYKTNVPDEMAVDKLRADFDREFTGMNWSFDLEDCDKILRMDVPLSKKGDVIELLLEKGFYCKEFPY